MTSPHVLIVDLALAPDIYRPTAHWRALLGEARTTQALPIRDAALPGLDAFTHVIITGCEGSITKPEPWYEPVERLIREAVDRRLPLFGSCFGHQLIVRALLGPAHVRSAASFEFGWFPLESLGPSDPQDATSFGPSGQRNQTFCCHFDEVCDLPKHRFEILARTPDCGVQAYRLHGAPVWGVQAHPEIDPVEGAALLETFAAQFPELGPDVERALASDRRDDGLGARLMARFLEAGQ